MTREADLNLQRDRRRGFRDSKDGKPFYCKTCGMGWNEMMACEEGDCVEETAEDAMRRFQPASPLEQARNSIIAALIGSCECNTKSPDAAHHLGYCRYLKLLTALDCIDAAVSRS